MMERSTKAKRGNRERSIRLISFALGGESYCVDINDLKEVVKLPPVTRVPNTPDSVVGVTNLRGEILSILDIRHLFGLAENGITDDSRLLVADMDGGVIGILVDGMRQTMDVRETDIQPPLKTLKGVMADHTRGHVRRDDDILVFLDLEKILSSQKIEV